MSRPSTSARAKEHAGSSWTGRAQPPSPRTLHERVGLPDQPHGKTASNTLLDRVQGVRNSSERTSGYAKTGRHTIWPAPSDEGAASSRPDQTVSAADVTSLEARIAQDPHRWPARGQEAPYRPSPNEPKRPSIPRNRSSDMNTSDHREMSRHTTSGKSAEAEQRNSAHIEDRGRIRVSEDGEVYRSPPQRPVRRDFLDARSVSANTSQAGPSTHVSSRSSASSSTRPIDLTRESDFRNTEKPSFSPLPPFARAGSGPTSESNGPYQGVPPQGFRKPSRFGREASRPPQIASTSNTRFDGSSGRDPYRPAPPRRTSLHYESARDYSEHHGTREAVPSRYDDRSRYVRHGYSRYGNVSGYAQPSTWDSHRSPPILASPAPSQLPGEEIALRDVPTTSQHNHNITDKDHRSRRSASPSRQRDTADAAQSRNSEGISRVRQDQGRATDSTRTPASRPTSYVSQEFSRPTTQSRPAHSATQFSTSFQPVSQASSSAPHVAEANSRAESCPKVSSKAHEHNRSSTKETGKQPDNAIPKVKKEPVSPAPKQPNVTQPLFNPPIYSPEERKPQLRQGFTPPPRPQSLPTSTAAAPVERTQPSSATRTHEHANLQVKVKVEPESTVFPRDRVAPSDSSTVARSSAAVPTTASPNSLGITSSRPAAIADTDGSDSNASSALRAVKPPVKHEISEDMDMDNWEADMEVDELSSGSSAEPIAGPSTTSACSNANSHKDRPDGTVSTPFTRPSSTASVSAKGKERALDVKEHDSARLGIARPLSSMQHVIDLATDDEAELVAPKAHTSASIAAPQAVTPRSIPPRLDALPTSGYLSTLQPPSIASCSTPREERTRVFSLPPKVVESLEAGGNRQRSALRRFLDEKYEELEVELRMPLQRIDEILRNSTIRLIYVEVDLAPNEIAIPLPQDCLRSNAGSSEERESRRSAFTTQQIVQLAKQGREAETTRLSAAHLIVSLEASKSATSATAETPRAQAAINETSSVTEQSSSAKNSGVPALTSASSALPPTAKPSPLEVQKQKDKKRKRQEGVADDTASISSLDSTTSASRRKDKVSVAKQARSSSDAKAPTLPSGAPQGASTLLPGKTVLPPLQTVQTRVSLAPKLAGASASGETRLTIRKHRLTSSMHLMHGSLSNRLKDSREKPRTFFEAGIYSKSTYIAVSMRGHLHYWAKNMDKASLISEDKHAHVSLTVQAALWSDQHRLAVLAYTSNSAAATANMQIVNMYGSRVRSPSVTDSLTY